MMISESENNEPIEEDNSNMKDSNESEVDSNDDILTNEIPKNKMYVTKEIKTSFDEVPVILGVVSWGAFPCGEEGAPTVFTKVTSYLDFINYNINE